MRVPHAYEATKSNVNRWTQVELPGVGADFHRHRRLTAHSQRSHEPPARWLSGWSAGHSEAGPRHRKEESPEAPPQSRVAERRPRRWASDGACAAPVKIRPGFRDR